MKIYYPLYYKDFECIADRCRHSCCVGWEIGVDDDTMEKYRLLPYGERAEIISHIGDDGCMVLADGERCPFLCESGLCRLISTYGDSHISHICREHPRFYHRVGEKIECGIGASCEEACRIILSSDFGEFFATEREGADIADETDFDSVSYREKIYSILHSDTSHIEKLEKIKALYSINDYIFRSDSLARALDELEYLDEAHRSLIRFKMAEMRPGFEIYFERFFAYLIFRHLSVAEHYDDLRARLGFCLLLLSILEGASDSAKDFADICEIARIISEEIEYSEDNTASLIFEIDCLL